jgi:hypothetical protein
MIPAVLASKNILEIVISGNPLGLSLRSRGLVGGRGLFIAPPMGNVARF